MAGCSVVEEAISALAGGSIENLACFGARRRRSTRKSIVGKSKIVVAGLTDTSVGGSAGFAVRNSASRLNGAGVIGIDIIANLALSALGLIVAAETVGIDRCASSAGGSVGSIVLDFTSEARGSS